MNPQKKRLTRSARGQTLVEFAIVLPLLAFLLFGIVQLGIVFNSYVTLTDATRAGARKAAVGRSLPDPAGEAEAAVRSSAVNLQQSDLVVDVAPSSNWDPGSDVTVTATYPYAIDLLGIVIKSGDLASSTTERVE